MEPNRSMELFLASVQIMCYDKRKQNICLFIMEVGVLYGNSRESINRRKVINFIRCS